MIDFNSNNIDNNLGMLIGDAIVTRQAEEPPRTYLGGSRLGHECERQLQFEYLNTLKDNPFTEKNCKAFELGHVLEDVIAGWLKLAGLDLLQREQSGPRRGQQFEAGISFPGVDVAPILMHCDGIIVGGPPIMQYPCLWECKTMMSKYWAKCKENGVLAEHPDYYGQVQVYQHAFGLTKNPALFTALNKDTYELYHELIDHAPVSPKKLIQRGERVVKACKRGALLPRMAKSKSFYKCKPAWCHWSERCWQLSD